MLTLDRCAGHTLDPDAWDRFVGASPQGSLYALHGYATAVRPDWEAWIVADQGAWQAVMPFCTNRRWGFRSLPQPMFTQYWGVLFRPMPELALREQLYLKKEILQLLIRQMDDFQLIVQNFSPYFDYGAPFHWGGFQLFQRYTYLLSLKPGTEALYAQLQSDLPRKIRRAQQHMTVLPGSVGELTALMEANQQAGRDITGGPVSFDAMRRMLEYLTRSGNGGIRCTSGREAALAYGHFGKQTLYLMGAFDPEQSRSNGMSLLMWELIRLAAARGDEQLDFEGSMIEGVEGFFRKFGASPVPYLQIRRNRLPQLIRWMHA
ncbi:MAG: GNAT family N-acetyltransferase [Bacteroidia bacterium]|nr:GNAT family N-acetyltransferase [Bacteroidia bacterium]